MSEYAQIGALVARRRENMGLTQAALAKLIGTTQSVVARIERGEQNLSTATLKKINQALGKEVVTLGTGADNFEIEGGRKLRGEVGISSSKNGAVAILCASLLNRGVTTIKKVPKIEEVFRLIEVFESIGVKTVWREDALTISPPEKFSLKNINRASGEKTRSVILMIGGLLRFFKDFTLPQAGGCKLGSRTVRPHFYALENLGVSIEARDRDYRVRYKKLHPGEIVMFESGDTATENAILAAAQIGGITTIKYASSNYQVQELCFFLEKLGVRIEGVGTTTLKIHGEKDFNKPITYSLSEDPTDSMFFIAAAILTKSSILIKRCPIEFLEIELLLLKKMGFRYKMSKTYLSENGRTKLVDLKTFPSNLVALEDKIHARPYPGLNMDNLPFFAVIATAAKGTTLIHDWVYEKRALYYTELDKLGATTVLADPHRIYITGPSKLESADLTCPPALRPATILLIGMLSAKGKSLLRNVYSINRGYENLVSKLNSLGAKIRSVQKFY